MTQEHILIVDDQLRMAQSLSRILSMPEGGGYHTDTSESGEDALARVRSVQYDLVITDLRMSGMTGIELLQQVSQITPSTGRILLTAYDSPQLREEASQVADAYVVKPVNPREFVETVRTILKAHPSASSTPPPPAAGTASPLPPPLIQKCEQLRLDVGALGVLVLDQAGKIVAESGQRGGFDVDAFMELLGNAMGTTNQATHLLEDQESFDLHLHQGKKYDIYTARVTDQIIVSVTIDRRGANTSSLGMVWLSLRRTIGEIRTLLSRPDAPVRPAPAPVREPEPPRPEPRPPAKRTPEPWPPPIRRRSEPPATPPPTEAEVKTPAPQATTEAEAKPAPPASPEPERVRIRPTPKEPPPPQPPPPSVMQFEKEQGGSAKEGSRLTLEEALSLGIVNPDLLALLGNQEPDQPVQ
ncbi:MAG: response regulator [Anaerolineae bacterium]